MTTVSNYSLCKGIYVHLWAEGINLTYSTIDYYIHNSSSGCYALTLLMISVFNLSNFSSSRFNSYLIPQPLIVNATSCWKMDWDELETNQQHFTALCHLLKEKVKTPLFPKSHFVPGIYLGKIT